MCILKKSTSTYVLFFTVNNPDFKAGVMALANLLQIQRHDDYLVMLKVSLLMSYSTSFHLNSSLKMMCVNFLNVPFSITFSIYLTPMKNLRWTT